MTLERQDYKILHDADPAVSIYPFPFGAMRKEDIHAYLINPALTMADAGHRTPAANYLVKPAAGDIRNGGEVEFAAGPPAGLQVEIVRETPRRQGQIYNSLSRIRPENIEEGLDKAMMVAQEQNTGELLQLIGENQGKIRDTQDALALESAARLAGDQAEAQARAAAEKRVMDALADETKERKGADANLQTQINAKAAQTALDAEASARIAADAALSDRVNLKADNSAVNAALAGKADKAELAAGLDAKADKVHRHPMTEVDGLKPHLETVDVELAKKLEDAPKDGKGYGRVNGVWEEIVGEKGDQGIQGVKGDQGDKGDRGEKGDQGDRGDKGDRGEKGDQGDQGEKGDKGDQGDQGDEGDQGIQGEKGEDGIAYTILGELADAGQLPGGADVKDAYLIGGDTWIMTPAGWLNAGPVSGPQGEKGDKGDRGEKGEPGDKGDQGEKGEDGDEGARGEKGDKGDRGEKGDQGDRGDQGDAGAAGPPGPKGDDGDSRLPAGGAALQVPVIQSDGSVAWQDLPPSGLTQEDKENIENAINDKADKTDLNDYALKQALTDGLALKANSSHKHDQGDVNNLPAALAAKADETALLAEATARGNADVTLAAEIDKRLSDAPKDGDLYGRRDGAWEAAQKKIRIIPRALYDAMLADPTLMEPGMVYLPDDITGQDAQAGWMVTPDYDNAETINRISSDGGTWVVDKPGFIVVGGASSGQSDVYMSINDVLYHGFIWDGNPHGCFQFPVATGDVVKIIKASNRFCYYIPPKFSRTPAPVVVVDPATSFPAGVEVDTGMLAPDGKKIYRKTYAFNSITGTTNSIDSAFSSTKDFTGVDSRMSYFIYNKNRYTMPVGWGSEYVNIYADGTGLNIYKNGWNTTALSGHVTVLYTYKS